MVYAASTRPWGVVAGSFAGHLLLKADNFCHRLTKNGKAAMKCHPDQKLISSHGKSGT